MVFALKTGNNEKYLRFRNEEVITYGLLQASADKVTDSYAHFEFLNSDVYLGLVHIRCRFNNKFLVRWSPNHYWLIAAADKPNDNKKNWACTLFERIDLDDDGSTGKLRLKHVQLGHYACVFMLSAPFDACLFAMKKEIDENSMDVFTFVNVNKLLSPVSKRVAFKGSNGKYLGAHTKDGVAYVQFSYDDPNDPKAAHEMFSTPTGIVFIRCNYFGKFWRSDNERWIRADSEDPRGGSDAAAMFRIVPLGTNVISLLNMSVELIIKRYTSGGIQECLNAAVKNVNQDGVLQVIELGSSN